MTQGCLGRGTREAAVSLCNKLQENNSQKLCSRDGIKYMEITKPTRLSLASVSAMVEETLEQKGTEPVSEELNVA